jgi:hypothetical protein
MRVEPHDIGSYVHVLKRGARGLPITNKDGDKWRFVRSLYYLNDKYLDKQWSRNISIKEKGLCFRPEEWPERDPLVKILCYTLMPNHIHLLLLQTQDDGISKFMQKLGQSMTNHFNEKYSQQGSIFQGSYKGRTVSDDRYLRYVSAYIMTKNVFELYPNGGLEKATQNFEKAWKWALSYQYSSFGDYAGARNNSPVIDKDILAEIFPTPQKFMKFSKDVILGGKWTDVELQ